jgi:hypothetical protein
MPVPTNNGLLGRLKRSCKDFLTKLVLAKEHFSLGS